MQHSNIWSAVQAGDIDTLRKHIKPGVPVTNIGKQVDNDRWNLLHHAVMSRSLEMVKLVDVNFHPELDAENIDGMTPLMLACQEQCPVDVIIYLMEQMETYDSPSPLEFAIFQHRIDLAKAVIEYEANRANMRMAVPSTSPLYIVTTQTGNLELLHCLIHAPNNAACLFVSERNGDLTGLEEFAQTASYETEKKVACFEILFNILHPITNKPDEPLILDNEVYGPSYHRAVECMMNMYNHPADSIVEGVIAQDDRLPRALLVYPLLRYCTTLVMRPDEVILGHLKDNRLLNWFVHLFGPWRAIEQHVGKPVLEVFTLKRFARDVVREAVWQEVKITKAAKSSFLERLKSLDIPRELNDYLRYCDYSSTKYFLEHMNAGTRWLKTYENSP
uniref:ANK_REP_REGION domain-containing protein n=1 Tax=Anopheles christyi TaxID=43041 RepID=A0A182KDJ1_9DIPT